MLDKVFTHLELVERDFFGLQFLCVVDSRETQKVAFANCERVSIFPTAEMAGPSEICSQADALSALSVVFSSQILCV